MSTVLVSPRGQIVLPAALRRRLGIHAGTRLEVLEDADGLKLRVLRPAPKADVAAMAGMVGAPTRAMARTLDSFDPAAVLARQRKPSR